MPDRFEGYIEEVCRQVRWKRARTGLADELRTHLLDQRDACLAEGMDQEAAEAESIRQMGDPVAVGTQLDRVHRPKPQWDLMVLIGVLLAAGLVLQGTVFGELWDREGFVGSGWVVRSGALAILIGVVLMLAVYWLDYTALGAHPLRCFWLGYGLCLASFWASPVMGGRRVLLPTYLSLLSPVLIALLLYGLRGKGWRGLLLSLGGVSLCVVLALSTPSFATAGLILVSGTVLMLISVWRGWMGVSKGRATAVVLVCEAVPVLAGLAFHADSVGQRLTLALHPELDPLGRGYISIVIRSLLRGARWAGEGTGEGQEMPHGQTEYFLTWTIHRLGWWAGVALLALLVLLLALACRRAARQRGMLGQLLSAAAVMTLGGQVVFYTAANLGFALTGTLALPFLSWGRWYMVIDLVLAGLMLSVFREERLPGSPERTAGEKKHKKCTVLHRDGEIVITIPLEK